MTTLNKTFVFSISSDGFIGYPASADITMSFDLGYGNPSGSIKTRINGRNKSGTSYWEWSGTWEDLGVPAGEVITQVRINDADNQCTEYNVVDECTIGPYSIYDSLGTTLIATLWAGRTATGVEGSWTAIGNQTYQSIASAYEASNTTIKIRLYDTLDLANDGAAACSIYEDTISLDIDHESGAHDLTANSIITTPVVGTPTIGQKHVLTATGITTNPVVGTPIFTGIVDLTATGITTTPVVGTPSIGQKHVLDATGITTDPVLGIPSIGQKHVLDATGITTDPVVGTPSIGQKHALVSVDITTDPVVGTPAIGLGGDFSTPTFLDAVSANGNELSVTSGTISPTGGGLLIAVLSYLDAQETIGSIADTLIGTDSWNWVEKQLTSGSDGDPGIMIGWAKAGSSPGSGTITVTYAASGSARNNRLIIYEVTGQNPATPIAQSGSNEGSGTNLIVTLGGTPGSSNMVFGAITSKESATGGNVLPGSGFTELNEYEHDAPAGINLIQTQYDLGLADTTCDWSNLENIEDDVAVAIEIVDATPLDDNLVANDITVNSVVGTPTIGQTHVLGPVDITTNPLVGTPTLTAVGALIVKQTGGDYSTLNAALIAADPGDTISIEGTWSIDDTTNCQINDSDLVIQTDEDSKHPGYWDESQNHYRLVCENHALTLSGPYTILVDGLAIEQASIGSSHEAFRVVPSVGYVATVRNCLLRCTTNTDAQDVVYTGYDLSIGVVTFENCNMSGAGRGGINVQNFYIAARTGTLNVNSCILWNNGRDLAPAGAAYVGGGIVAANKGGSDGSGFTINVHNTISVENDTGGNYGAFYPLDYNVIDEAGIPIGAFNVSYSIDSDNSIVLETDGGTGNLAIREATDNTDPGEGDWVIFEDITTFPYDLRLVDNVENDAQDAHTTATAEGLTILETDIVGTIRPQNTDYDIGSFEIPADDVDNLTADSITTTSVVGTPSVGQEHALGSVDITANSVVETPSVGQTHVLDSIGITTDPVVETPSIGQEHALDSVDITANPVVDTPILATEGEDNLVANDITSNPVLDTPSVGQEHALDSVDITADPVVGAPTFTGVVGLTGNAITSDPVVGTPSIGQQHVLVGVNITADPLLGTPTLSTEGEDNLVANDITSNPVLETPSIGQEHTLTSVDITADSILETPSIGQEHVLASVDITADPVVETPSVGQEHALGGVDITSNPVVGTPSIGQEHALAGVDITSNPVVGTPVLSTEGEDNLVANDITVDPVLETPSIGQEHALSGTDITTAAVVGTPTLSSQGEDNLTATGITTAPIVETSSIGQTHILNPTDIITTPVVEDSAIGQTHALSSNGIEVLPVVETPTLAHIHVLDALNVYVIPEVETPSVGQIHLLEPLNITATPILETSELGQTHILYSIGIETTPTTGTPAWELIEGIVDVSFDVIYLDVSFDVIYLEVAFDSIYLKVDFETIDN